MTSAAHQSGTDRIAEVARGWCDDEIVIVNVQGDEPEIEPEIIDGLIERLETSRRRHGDGGHAVSRPGRIRMIRIW